MLTKKNHISLRNYQVSAQGFHLAPARLAIAQLLCGLLMWAGIAQAQPMMADLKPILDTKSHSIYLYQSSIKNLPPDWKKAWVLTNFYQDPSQAALTVLSTRRNVLGTNQFLSRSESSSIDRAVNSPKRSIGLP